MAPNIPLILRAVLEEYALPWDGAHGIAHWARVLENGRRLASETGADIEVVSLFAVLHDSRRTNEHTDPDHGPRAAEFARTLRGHLFDLSDHGFGLLHRACAGHTYERTHPNVTIQACWDSDRLDLGRVGITPHPSRLCTEVAKRAETIRWADARGTMHVIPMCVESEWGIDLASGRLIAKG
jgi:uncharacterized protein